MERSMDISFDFRIKDFHTSERKILQSKDLKHPYTDSNITFSVAVFPDGADEGTEGRIVVLPSVKFNDQLLLHNTFLSWTVSINDINDDPRFHRSFGMNDRDIFLGGPSQRTLSNAVYLKRDFILREDNELEFLPEGVLTLRCYISFSWYEVLPEYPPSRLQNDERLSLRFLQIIRNLTLASRKNFQISFHLDRWQDVEKLIEIMEEGIHGTSQSDVLRYNRLIERILHIKDESKNRVGHQLLKAYPVIEEWVIEHRENGIQMTNLDEEIFTMILLLLTMDKFFSEKYYHGSRILNYGFRGLEFNTLLNVYKFSHLFRINRLKKICASEMSNELRTSPIRGLLEKELEGIAFIYSDEHLCLELHQHTENYEGSPFRDFFSSVPQSISSDTFKVFDLTEDIRKLKDRFFIDNYGWSFRSVRETHSEFNEYSPNITESVWIFETFTDKFCLSFDEYKNSLGAKLLNASPVIRLKVGNARKGGRENRIGLPEVESETFKIVLYYLMSRELYEFGFHLLNDVYKFAKRNEMDELQRDCAAEMFRPLKAGSALENVLEKNPQIYSDDEYFLELLRRRRRADGQTSLLRDFFSRMPQTIRSEKDNVRGDPEDAFTVFDLTKDIRELKDFYPFPKQEGCPRILRKTHSELNEKAENIEKIIFTFRTYTDRFKLSFNEHEESLGFQLLNASPVIRQKMSNAMKGRIEIWIDLPGVESETFKIVLFYLMSQELHEFEFHQLVNVYEFAERNEMVDLQRKCSAVMFEVAKDVRPLEKELDAISYVYSDEYLSELLRLRRKDDNQMSLFEHLFNSIPQCNETNHSKGTFTVFDFTPDFSEVKNCHSTFRKYSLDRKRGSELNNDSSNVEEQDSTIASLADKFFQSLPKDRQDSEPKESFHSIFRLIFKKRFSENNEDYTNVKKQVWIFDTHPDRFLLSLPEGREDSKSKGFSEDRQDSESKGFSDDRQDSELKVFSEDRQDSESKGFSEDRQDSESKGFSEDRLDSLGFRLLEASKALQNCVGAEMKEKEKKHVELSVVDSETFKIVLFFLISGTLPESRFHQLLKVYQFSDYYIMEELKRTCADEMVKHAEERSHLEKAIREIRNIYPSDTYLQRLIGTYLDRYSFQLEERDLRRLSLNDNLLSHCYV